MAVKNECVTTVVTRTKLYRYDGRAAKAGELVAAEALDAGVMVSEDDPGLVNVSAGEDVEGTYLTPDQARAYAKHIIAAARVAERNATPKIAKKRGGEG